MSKFFYYLIPKDEKLEEITPRRAAKFIAQEISAKTKLFIQTGEVISPESFHQPVIVASNWNISSKLEINFETLFRKSILYTDSEKRRQVAVEFARIIDDWFLDSINIGIITATYLPVPPAPQVPISDYPILFNLRSESYKKMERYLKVIFDQNVDNYNNSSSFKIVNTKYNNILNQYFKSFKDKEWIWQGVQIKSYIM